jgi:sialate O-acetylesterase
MDNYRRKILFFLLFLFAGRWCTAQVRLPQLIADKMVVQRDIPVTVWGWASPGERVIVELAGRRVRTIAASDSSWEVKLPSMKAGGPFVMRIRGSNQIEVKDILVGDVWFCSGQSNMVIPMERVKERYPDDIAHADLPQIRNFFVPTAADVTAVHSDLPHSDWKEASPEEVLGFGAASFFFARSLYEKYHVPIGIINSSVGGTPIQAWVSAAGLSALPGYAERIAKFSDTGYMRRVLRKPVTTEGGSPMVHPDRGLTEEVKWYESGYVPAGWHPFWLPGYWADQGIKGLNGVVWFRREIAIPASMAGKPAKLFVGRIVDADETYVNGVQVGNIAYQYPPRRYEVPADVLKEGKNLLVVRVTNTIGKGGFVPDKRYELTDGVTHIDIRGDWQYKVGQVFSPRPAGGGGAPFVAQNEPTGLFNTMVAPAIRYGVKGFVWYQGEANTGNAREYGQLLPALIADWRRQWKNRELPFLYVQLPNFMEAQYSPSESQWAELREAELNASSVPGTAMAVTIDAGEWNDIHPLDKKDVGDRLALAAEKLAYGDQAVVASGPIFQSARVAGNKIEVSFMDTGSGLMVKGGGELQQFAIAGADKKFVWADARIEGDKVIVSSGEVTSPLYVRYAWADNPQGANLYNREGLPASPFRTDQNK